MTELIKRFIDYEGLKGYTRKVLIRKERELMKFLQWIEKPLTSVTQEDIAGYLSDQEFPNSYNRRLGYIKQFFAFLLEEGEVLLDPALQIPRREEPESQCEGVFTVDEMKLLVDSTSVTPLGRRDRAILELFYSSGMRLFELVNLNVDDVDLRHNEVLVLAGKGGHERIVPVGDRAVKSVKKYLDVRDYFLDKGREFDALFLSSWGNRMDVSTVREMVRRRKKDAGIESVGVSHALRHSCATHLLNGGAPLNMIQRLLGHGSLHATEMYAHIADEERIREFHERRPRHDEADA